MALPARQTEFQTALTDLLTLVRNADVDLAANDPDSPAIMRLREQASAALAPLGFNSQEPQ
jgi:hypothetical protein